MKCNNPDVKFILEALIGILMAWTAEGDLLLEDQQFELFKNTTWAVASPIDLLLCNILSGKNHVLRAVAGKDQTARLVDSRRLVQECTPETSPRRFIIVSMMKSWRRMTSCTSAVEHLSNETAMHARTQASNRLARANRASHGPRLRAKARVKRTGGKSKGKSKGTKGAKGSHKGKTSKTGVLGLENSKSDASSKAQESAQTYTTDTSWNWWLESVTNGTIAGVLMDGTMTGALLDGTKGWEQTYDTSASSFYTWKSWSHGHE